MLDVRSLGLEETSELHYAYHYMAQYVSRLVDACIPVNE